MSSPCGNHVGPAQCVPLLLSPYFELPQTSLGSAGTWSCFIPTFLQQRQDLPCRHWEGTSGREGASGPCPCFSTGCVGWGCGPVQSQGLLKVAAEELVKEKWAARYCMTNQEAETLFELVSNQFCNVHQTCTPDLQPVWRCLMQEWMDFAHLVILNGMTIKIIPL